MAKVSPLMLAPPLIFAAFVGMAAVGMFRDDPDALPSARQGQPAPPLPVTALADKPLFTDADLRAGEVVLVNYWASWCAPCRVEHPHLMALAEEGVPIYGVNYKDGVDKAVDFLDELGDPYAGVGQDLQGRIGLDWGLYGVPETYVIDAEGVIQLRFAGPVTQRVLDETIRPAIEAARQ